MKALPNKPDRDPALPVQVCEPELEPPLTAEDIRGCENALSLFPHWAPSLVPALARARAGLAPALEPPIYEADVVSRKTAEELRHEELDNQLAALRARRLEASVQTSPEPEEASGMQSTHVVCVKCGHESVIDSNSLDHGYHVCDACLEVLEGQAEAVAAEWSRGRVVRLDRPHPRMTRNCMC